MRTKTKKIPLYTGKLTIIQTEKEETLSDVAKVLNIDFDVSNYDGMACIDKHNYIVAFIDKTTPSIIAHESIHAVGFIFQEHNIRMDANNDEPIAYLLEWIVRECHRFLNIDYSK